MPRVAIYARYSSDNQRDSRRSRIRWPFAVAMRIAKAGRWSTGTRIARSQVRACFDPGIQSLMEDAGKGGFDMVFAEALDRLSRDQEDVAGIFKRVSFAGVKIVTLSEGEISPLHVGLKGTMNALFLKDLADKTRRSLQGRIEAGKSAGEDFALVMTWSKNMTMTVS